MTATPRPWKVISKTTIDEVNGNRKGVICRTTFPDSLKKDATENEANAALIVKAVNTHERAKKALRYACRILLTEAENYRDGDEYQPRGKSLLKEAEIIQTTLTDMEG